MAVRAASVMFLTLAMLLALAVGEAPQSHHGSKVIIASLSVSPPLFENDGFQGLAQEYQEPNQGYQQPHQEAVSQQSHQTPQATYEVPEQVYETPKSVYAPPQTTYAPPIQTYPPPRTTTYPPPRPTYPPKRTYPPPKPTYSPPRPTYAPSKPRYEAPRTAIYAPPKQTYPPPQPTYSPPRARYEEPKSVYGSPVQSSEITQAITSSFSAPEDTYGAPQEGSFVSTSFTNSQVETNVGEVSTNYGAPSAQAVSSAAISNSYGAPSQVEPSISSQVSAEPSSTYGLPQGGCVDQDCGEGPSMSEALSGSAFFVAQPSSIYSAPAEGSSGDSSSNHGQVAHWVGGYYVPYIIPVKGAHVEHAFVQQQHQEYQAPPPPPSEAYP